MRTVTELITPEIAREYLLRNKRNRVISQAHVAAFVKTIKAGQFHLTHQGVGFFEDGSLADGQHRLEAISIARTAVHVNVTYGIPQTSLTAIDTQVRVRSYADALQIAGHSLSSKQTVACVRVCLMLQGIKRPALFEVRNFFDAHFEAIEKSNQIANGNAILQHGCFLAMLALGCENGHADKLTEWADTIRSGVAREEWQTSATRLREWWMSNRHHGGSDERKQFCHRIYSSMVAWIERRGLSLLRPRDRIDWLFNTSDEIDA